MGGEQSCRHCGQLQSQANPWLEGLIYSMPWHAIFAFVNPLLIGVLQVKAQGESVSPLDTHPGDMWIFLVATLVYCLALAANIKCHRRQSTTNYSRMSGHVALLSGSLSSVSLLSIFLPRLLGRLIFLSWTILPLLVARELIHHIFHWLFQWTTNAVSLFLSIVGNRFRASNLAEQQSRPPV